MRVGRKPTVIGRYTLYLGSVSDAIKEYHSAFFGSNRASKRTVQETLEVNSSKNSPKPENGLEKLEEAVEKTQNILVKSNSIFPFDLFPDTITIDRQKLTVVHHTFFSSKQSASVQHSAIKNIQAEVGPFMGSLTVTSEHFINNTQTIKYLPKKDVLAIQQLVQGFIIANNENVDMSDIEDEKLIELLNRLGRGEAGEKVVHASSS
ncbi:MAG: hypothetical protein ACHQT9_02900 [Candidatus Saccharimonadales bacterium]